MSLISPDEWESFLASLLGFVSEAHGADQNSYYNDHSNEAPLGDYFIESWGWLPSIQQMPGYHYFDYLTQDIDPEFLEWAYAVHSSASVFRDAGINLADIENMPFTMNVGGVMITATWHSGTPPTANLHTNPNDSSQIVVTANQGYFTVDCQTGPGTGNETPPNAFDMMNWTAENYPFYAVVNEALSYLAESPAALSLLWQARQAGVKIHIVTGQSITAYDSGSNTVFWNPAGAVLLSNGAIQSSALGLIHEIAHAIGRLTNIGFDLQYGDTEERRVIEQYEQIIATQLGEPVRNNHGGTYYWNPESVRYHRGPQ